MKRTILFLIISFFSFSLWSQSDQYTYQPFIMDGTCEWIETANYGYNGARVFISNEDTLILGKTYKKVLWDMCDQPNIYTYSGAIREENKQVFFFDGVYNDDFSENLIYDFNMKVGDRMEYRGNTHDSKYNIEVLRIDTIEIEGILRRKFYFDVDPEGYTFTWTEGIGCVHDFTRPTISIPTAYTSILVGVWQGDKALYRLGDKCTCDELLSTINKQTFVPDFYIQQNPVKDKLLSVALHDAAFTQMDIYSWDGKLMLTKEIDVQNGTMEIPLASFSSGTYILILSRADNSRESTRIVVL